MKLAVIGTGYVGLVTGAGFADFGNDVTCVDIDQARIALLERGELPFYEPGLVELVGRNRAQGRLRFTTATAAAVAGAEIAFIAVGTPSDPSGQADLSAVLEAARQIGRAITGYTVVVTKSTVPVGTADQVKATIAAETTQPFAVASNPEFLKEGDAVNDFLRPARVVVGADDPQALDVLRRLYTGFLRTSDRIQTMSLRSAELTKYAANAMLATRISFMNELALLAEKVGADIDRVRVALGADPRIGPKFLFPGVGFGGSCLVGSETVLIRQGHVVRLARLDSLVPRADGVDPICVRPEDLEVLAVSEPGQPPRFLPIAAITRRPYEGELCLVRTKMGRRVLCTPDHPFVVVDHAGDAPTVLRAEELQPASWLPIVTTPASNAVEACLDFDLLGALHLMQVPDERVIVRAGDRVRTPELTEALRPVVRDKYRLADIRSTGTLRLHEARAAGLDLAGVTLGTSRSGTYVPATLPNTPAFWRMVGLYCAEGWISTDLGRDGARRMRIAWAFHPRDEEHLVDDIVSFWASIGVKVSVFTTPTSRKVSVSSRLLALWLLEVLGVGGNCYRQRVPDALWSAPVEHKRAFLAGLWHGDGSWSYVANRRGVVLQYGTASREIADGVMRLLAESGIVSAWYVGRPPGSTVDTHFVSISGADQVERVIDFCKPEYRDEVRRAIAAQHKRIAPTGYRRDPVPRVRVVSVERRRFQGYVFSLEVPGAETFVTTGGLVVHNCFPKDLRALARTGRDADQPQTVVEAVLAANERQKRLVGERLVAQFGGSLAGRRVAVWGLAFKPETDDIRESPALPLIEQVNAAGGEVRGYDPAAMPNIARAGLPITLVDDPYTAAEGADAVVLVTEWHQLRHPDYPRLRAIMREPIVFDGRNVWNPDEARAAGFRYFGIGRP